MNLLREYIRELLEVDLGQKVWAPEAPEGHPHHGEEPNTPIEKKLYSAFFRWIHSNDSGVLGSEDVLSAIRQAASDPKYNDVIKFAPPGTTVYRGLRVNDWHIEKNTGLNDEQFWEAMSTTSKSNPFKPMSDFVSADHEVKPWGPIKQGLTSWSMDMESAARFASRQQDSKSTREVGILLVADTAGGDFIDFSGVYDYADLGQYRGESEIVSIGPVRISGVYFYQPQNKRFWQGSYK